MEMCNWRAWLLPGLLTMMMLTALAVLVRGGPIEADLTARSMTMLERDGTAWASATADGRTIALTGTAPTEAARAAAIASIRRVVGVADVDETGLDLLPLADPYSLTFEKTPDTIIVSGSFPNGETRVALLDDLRAGLGSLTLIDDTRLARGAPIDFATLATFAATSVPALETGTVMLENNTLSVTGDTQSLEAYNAEVARLASPPEGLVLADITLTPPEIAPYVWSAEATAAGVMLSGYVPDAETRETVVLAAEPLGLVTDRMAIARGAPDGFAATAVLLLEQMAGLDNGTASINDRNLSLTGDAATSEAYRSANTFLGALPTGFDSLSGQIAPPVADPFQTTLAKSGDGYALSGALPDETARAVLLDALQGQGGTITDTATIARGAPEGIAIGDLFARIAAILSGMEDGVATLMDNDLTVTGAASDGEEAQAVSARLEALANEALAVRITIRAAQP